MDGIFGTWTLRILTKMVLKDELLDALISKLNSTNASGRYYVFFYFKDKLLSVNTKQFNRLIRVLKIGLKNGDLTFYEATEYLISKGTPKWKNQLKDGFNSFVEKSQESEEDDLPF